MVLLTEFNIRMPVTSESYWLNCSILLSARLGTKTETEWARQLWIYIQLPNHIYQHTNEPPEEIINVLAMEGVAVICNLEMHHAE